MPQAHTLRKRRLTSRSSSMHRHVATARGLPMRAPLINCDPAAQPHLRHGWIHSTDASPHRSLVGVKLVSLLRIPCAD